jgi:curved DNA-binding protein CbpA
LKSLYAILDIDVNATTKEVHAAYRRLAKTLHPDAGGGREAYDEIAKAHEVLSDPKRREGYDQSGQTDKMKIDEISAITQIIQQNLLQVMNAAAQQGLAPEHHDLVTEILRLVVFQVSAIEGGLSAQRASLKRMEKHLGRFSRSDDRPELIENLIRQQIKTLRKDIAQNKIALEAHKMAETYLRAGKYRLDEPVMPNSQYIGFFTATRA